MNQLNQEQVEYNRCQNTSLFDTYKNFKRIWLLATSHDPGLHTVLKLPQHGQKVGAAAEFCQYFPKQVTIHSIKYLGKVYESKI